MPYRGVAQEEHTETCWCCEDRTGNLCDCCGRPTCARHLEKSSWCFTCESTFFRYKKGTSTDGTVGWWFGIGGVLGAAGVYSSFALPVLVAWILLGIPATWAVRKGRMRGKFLRRYRQTGKMLEPPKPRDGINSGYQGNYVDLP